jgi:Tol biopolymer transport system component
MRRLRGFLAVFAMLVPSFVPLAVDHVAVGATPVPRLTVGDLTVVEADSGKVAVRVPIDLDVPTATKLYVYYKVTGGTATPRVDFAAPLSGVRTGKIGIAANTTEAFISVGIFGDTVWEPDETVFIDVTSVAGATIVRSRGTLTIQNNDVQTATLTSFSASPPSASLPAAALVVAATPRLSIGAPTIWEGNTGIRHAAVPLTLSDPAPATIKVTYKTPGTDDGVSTCNDLTTATVAAVTKTLTFLIGQQSKNVMVPVRGNMSVSPALTTVVDSVSVVSGSATIAQPASDIVVVDDDGPSSASPPAPGTYRVSESADGSNPTFPRKVSDPSIGCDFPSSTLASISADGRFVAFSSNVNNLVGNDTNGYTDTFVKDTWTSDIERVSVASDGTQADGASFAETISADGRYVVFASDANNLVPGDDNSWRDSFVKDRVTGAVQRLGDIHTANVGSRGGSISADGRYVAFVSDAPLTGGCVPCTSVFLLDQTTNGISLVSTGPGGQLTSAGLPAISGDGRHVAFGGPDILGRGQMFVKDLDTGTLEVVSVNNAGQLGVGTGGGGPEPAAISYDGQVVAFVGQYCNMGLASWICGTGTGVYNREIWVRDRVARTTTLASVASDGTPIFDDGDSPSLSSDGRYVLFETDDASFAPECPATGGRHVYERDRTTGTTVRVDLVASATAVCAADTFTLSNQAMSADGSFVTYTSLVENVDVSATNPEAVYVTRLR